MSKQSSVFHENVRTATITHFLFCVFTKFDTKDAGEMSQQRSQGRTL